MSIINDIFRQHSHEYLERFGNSIPSEHRKVINAILHCRTETLGFTLYQCEDCGKTHSIFRSCGNRHCPGCQHSKTIRWLQKQQSRQLPGDHFMITFTVPQELRAFIRSHQRIAYQTLFSSSSGAIKTLAADERIGSKMIPGFFGVLHTWGRQLQYHPHIHYVVPAGMLTKSGDQWHKTSSGFYMNVRALSKIFRAKFRDAMNAAGLLSDIPNEVWKTDWNVNCKPAGDGSAVQKYLAPYVFKVAISNSRIVSFKAGRVTIRYKKSNSNRLRTMILPAMEFIRRFLQHVLPTGFMKIRYYGFLHPSFFIPLASIRSLITKACQLAQKEGTTTQTPLTAGSAICPDCGGPLIYLGSVLPYQDRLLTG